MMHMRREIKLLLHITLTIKPACHMEMKLSSGYSGRDTPIRT